MVPVAWILLFVVAFFYSSFFWFFDWRHFQFEYVWLVSVSIGFIVIFVTNGNILHAYLCHRPVATDHRHIMRNAAKNLLSNVHANFRCHLTSEMCFLLILLYYASALRVTVLWFDISINHVLDHARNIFITASAIKSSKRKSTFFLEWILLLLQLLLFYYSFVCYFASVVGCSLLGGTHTHTHTVEMFRLSERSTDI